MAPAQSSPIALPPDDTIRRATEDSKTRAELFAHAAARLRTLMADRPPVTRADLAMEAVQETVKRALNRQADYDASRATPAGWLHAILNNVLSEQRRKVRKQPAQPAADPAAWDGLTSHFAADNASDLVELLDALSADQRQIVTMHHLDAKSHREIAAALGISEPASRVRLARAMIELRQLAARKEGGR